MQMGYGFPWPLVMLAVMAIMAMVMIGLARVGLHRAGRVPRCGPSSPRRADIGPAVSRAGADPLVTLRDRYAHSEIDADEFERRLDGLLRTEPAEKTHGRRP